MEKDLNKNGITKNKNSEEEWSGETDVLLRHALETFMPDDSNENYKKIDFKIRDISKKYYKYFLLKRIITYFGLILLVSSGGMLFLSVFSDPSKEGEILYFTIIISCFTFIPSFVWHIYEYGLKWSSLPLKIPYQSDDMFEKFLEILQKEPSGKDKKTRIYSFSATDDKPIPIDRRIFYSRFRYLLFSDNPKDRQLVTLPTGLIAVPANIYIHYEDLYKIIQQDRPRRRGVGGRSLSPRNAEMIVNMIGDPRLAGIIHERISSDFSQACCST